MAKTTNKQPSKGNKPVTIEDRIKRIEATLKKIERKVSDDAAFRLFVQSLVKEHNEQLAPAEERGLMRSDYTDASKEVADELTAMGYKWHAKRVWTAETRLITYYEDYKELAAWKELSREEVSRLPSTEFIARARVTAKRLGLEPPKPWKPEVGQYVQPSARSTEGWVLDPPKIGVIERIEGTILFVRELSGVLRNGIESFRYEPMSPEEVAKYHADIEAAKPIEPFTTRVKTTGGEWLVIHGPSPSGDYTLQRDVDGYCYTLLAERHEFTVIP